MTSPPPQAPDLPDELEEIIWNELPDRIRQGPLHTEMTEACRAIARACFDAGRAPLLDLIENMKIIGAEQHRYSLEQVHRAEKAERERDSWRRTAEKLEGEKLELRADRDRCVKNMNDAAEHNDELRAQLEAAQKDAERYRWLRTFESGAHPVWLRMCEIDFCDEEMDAAIDAARAEKP